MAWLDRMNTFYNDPLDHRGLSSLRDLIVLYKTLSTPVINDEAVRIADSIADRYRTQQAKPPPPLTFGKWLSNFFKRFYGGVAVPPDALTYKDIYALEMAILSLQPVEGLQREAWNLRARYRDIVGADVYALYLQSKLPETSVPCPPDAPPPAAPATDDPALRADLRKLLGEIQWHTTFYPKWSQVRAKAFAALLMLITSVLLVCLGIYFTFQTHKYPRPLVTISLVVLVGIVGGSISTQRRLQELPKGVRLNNLFELSCTPLSLYLAPLSGAVFAILLYLLFMGRMVEGTLFPRIGMMLPEPIIVAANAPPAAPKPAPPVASKPAKPATKTASAKSGKTKPKPRPAIADANPKPPVVATSAIAPTKPQTLDTVEKTDAAADAPVPFNWDNLSKSGPLTLADFGKLLVWCFLAGFAERFVPDTLDRLVNKTKALKQSQPT